MCQDRLSSLEVLAVEKELAKNTKTWMLLSTTLLKESAEKEHFN
jgi:hypothetical protein